MSCPDCWSTVSTVINLLTKDRPICPNDLSEGEKYEFILEAAVDLLRGLAPSSPVPSPAPAPKAEEAKHDCDGHDPLRSPLSCPLCAEDAKAAPSPAVSEAIRLLEHAVACLGDADGEGTDENIGDVRDTCEIYVKPALAALRAQEGK